MMLANKTGRPRKYHFSEMQVGEEQFHPSGARDIAAHENLIQTAAAGQVGASGKFKTRRIQMSGKVGVKIKRVAQ